MPCVDVITIGRNPSLLSSVSKSLAKSTAAGSRPKLTFIAISHADAALTKISLACVIRLCARSDKDESPVTHQSRV